MPAGCTTTVRLPLTLHPDRASGQVDCEPVRCETLLAAAIARFTRLAHILQVLCDGLASNRILSGGPQMNEAISDNLSRQSVERHDDTLSRQFNDRLRVIAMQAVTYWFSHDRLDNLLAQYIGSLEDCELLYAIDASGRQISSNIYTTAIDLGAYGQDLSRRPYAVNLSVLSNVASKGAFVCDTYLSKATGRPCATVMYGVTSGASFMGFIAADFSHAAD
jgi:hypothetical protein